MPKQTKNSDVELKELYGKLFDIEECISKIKTLNDLFIPFANENCPQGSLISELIAKEIDAIYSIIAK